MGTRTALVTVDEALVLRSQAGDTEAMGELAGQVRPLVQRYASRFFPDPSRAEDLAQTALMKAFARVGDVRSPEAFAAWLLRITRNECLNELARQRHAQVPLSTLDDRGTGIEVPPGGPEDPEEELVRNHLRRLVRQVAATLPPHYRQTLTMRALEDRSYEEISVALDVPVTVARLWYCRARKRFRAAFLETMVARRGMSEGCHEMGLSIAGMIEGTLTRPERDRVQGHLADCSVCRQTEEELRNTAFRAPSRAFLLGLGLLRLTHPSARVVRGSVSRAHHVIGRVAVAGAGGVSLATAGAFSTVGTAPAAGAPGAGPLTAAVTSGHSHGVWRPLGPGRELLTSSRDAGGAAAGPAPVASAPLATLGLPAVRLLPGLDPAVDLLADHLLAIHPATPALPGVPAVAGSATGTVRGAVGTTVATVTSTAQAAVGAATQVVVAIPSAPAPSTPS